MKRLLLIMLLVFVTSTVYAETDTRKILYADEDVCLYKQGEDPDVYNTNVFKGLGVMFLIIALAGSVCVFLKDESVDKDAFVEVVATVFVIVAVIETLFLIIV